MAACDIVMKSPAVRRAVPTDFIFHAGESSD
jgi:hypothetical protein